MDHNKIKKDIKEEKNKLEAYILAYYGGNEEKAKGDLHAVDEIWKNLDENNIEDSKEIANSLIEKYKKKKDDKRKLKIAYISAIISTIILIFIGLLILGVVKKNRQKVKVRTP